MRHWFAIEAIDQRRNDGQTRWITIGSDPYDRHVVLVVVWTEQADENVALTRIISARHASKRERQNYEKEIYQ